MTSTGSAPSPHAFASLWSPSAADDSLSSASPSPPAFLLDATFAPQQQQQRGPTTSFTGVIPDINVSAYASPPIPLTTAFNPPMPQQPPGNGTFASRFGGMGTDSPFGVAPPGYEATAPLQQPYSLAQPPMPQQQQPQQQPLRHHSLSPKSMALQPSQLAQFAQPAQLGIAPVGVEISGEAKRRRVSVADIRSVPTGNVGMIANAGMNRRSSGPSLAPPALALSLKPSNITAAPVKQAPLKRKASDDDDDDDGPTGHNAVEKRYRNKINTHISTLQSLVPALAHLVDPPEQSPTHRRKSSAFVLSSAPQIPAGTMIDGVEAAQKLSKGVVLQKAIEYIRFLLRERDILRTERELTAELLSSGTSGGEAVLEELERRWDASRIAMEEQAAADQDDDDKPRGGATKARRTVSLSTKQRRAPAAKSRTDSSMSPPGGSSQDETAPIIAVAPPPPLNPQPAFSYPPIVDGTFGFNPSAMNMAPPPQMYTRAETAMPMDPAQMQAYHQFLRQQPLQPVNGHSTSSRTLLAMFAGVSFVGGVGYDWSFSRPGSAAEGPSRAWAAGLARRTAGDAIAPSAASSPVPTALLTGFAFLGVAAAIAGVVVVLMALRTRDPASAVDVKQRRRTEALAVLSDRSAHAHHAEALRQARQAYAALLVLANAPTTVLGAIVALVGQSILNVFGLGAIGFDKATEAEQIEQAVALVRLVELETAYREKLSYFWQRLYSFNRLLALSRSSAWANLITSKSPSQLNSARVQATLSLHFVSIFGGRASPLSRRRRLWKAATAEPKKDADLDVAEPPLEDWVAVALAASFEEASAALTPVVPVSGMMPSPSDSLPLLRVAETRCEHALIRVWYALFTSISRATALGDDGDELIDPSSAAALKAAVMGQADLKQRIDAILASTVTGSPVHTLAQLTRGVWAVGVGDQGVSRDVAFKLALEARDGGPAERLASVAAYVRLVLAPTVGSCTSAAGAQDAPPVGPVDCIAALALRWLLVRARAEPAGDEAVDEDADVEEAGFDRDVYGATLNLRLLFDSPAFHPTVEADDDRHVVKAFAHAQRDCMDAIVRIGRRAAGLRPL